MPIREFRDLKFERNRRSIADDRQDKTTRFPVSLKCEPIGLTRVRCIK
jgi:hypothetical protein